MHPQSKSAPTVEEREGCSIEGLSAAQVLTELSIDSACATVAEVRKRGDKFWDEFEFYLSDLVVGMVLDVVLVTLMAPVAVIGAYPKMANASGEAPISLLVLPGDARLECDLGNARALGT